MSSRYRCPHGSSSIIYEEKAKAQIYNNSHAACLNDPKAEEKGKRRKRKKRKGDDGNKTCHFVRSE
jgi:hypothetical protein